VTSPDAPAPAGAGAAPREALGEVPAAVEPEPVAPPSHRRHRRGWRRSIGTVMALGFGGLVAIAVAGVLYIGLGAASRTTFDLLRSVAETGTEEIVQALDHHLQAPLDAATFVAGLIERGEVAPDDASRLPDLLIGALAATPQVAGIAFIRSDLTAMGAGRSPDGRRVEIMAGNWVNQPEMRLAVRNAAALEGPRWDDPAFMPTLGSTYLRLRVPVHVDGVFVGIVATAVSVSELSEILSQLPARLQSQPFVILGRDRVLAHPELAGGLRGVSADNPLPLLAEVGDPVLPAIWSPQASAAGDSFLEGSGVAAWEVEVGGEDQIFLYREVERYGSTPWLVGLHFPLAAVNAPVERLMMAGLLGLGVLVLAAVLALLLGRAIARPIRRMAEAAEAIGRFDLDAAKPLPRSALRELDAAARAYNAMLAALRWFELYVPRALVPILLQSGGSRLRPEEREVTIMLTDIVGFTPISSRLRPLQLARFLTRHFTLLGRCIEAEGGTVDKYMGDAVMAFWNAPSAQPDHAARACRAALAIGRAIKADNARRSRKGISPVRLRIGLHTGPAVVGNTGAPGRINYTLVGDTVNVCSRLEELGHEIDAGGEDTIVLLSGQTAAQLTPAFCLVPLGPRALRGTGAVFEVFRLVEPEAGREGSTAGTAASKADERAA
jgi:class 3 adenylate cyclase